MLLAKVVYSKAGIYFRIFYCDERKMIQVKYGETVVTSRGNTQIFINDFITDYVLRGIACESERSYVFSGSSRKCISLRLVECMFSHCLVRKEKSDKS